MKRFGIALTLAALLGSRGVAEESASQDVTWEKKYEQLLKERRDIRKKVESGRATMEQVIAWMKKGGDRQNGNKPYYGWKVEVTNPADFQQALENGVFSGPQPGEELPAFKALGINGGQNGKQYDPVAQAQDEPLVLIFQDQSTLARKGLFLLSPVVKTIADKSKTGLTALVVFLGDDPSFLARADIGGKKKGKNVYQMAHSLHGRDGPGAYGLNRNVAMTILVAREGKVLHNFAFTTPMLYPDPHLVGALAEVVNEKRETVISWLTEEKTRNVAIKEDQRKKGGEQSTTQSRRYRNRRHITVEDPAKFMDSQQKTIFSGPQPDEQLPPFKVTSVAGDTKGQELDPIALAGDHPQVLIFQDEGRVGIRGLFGLADSIAKIERKTDTDMLVSSVFLSDNTETISQMTARFSQSLLERGIDIISVSPDGRDGPGAYGLNRSVSQTIILAKNGKVTQNFVFPQGLLYADPHVMGGIAELIGQQRETVAGWLKEDTQEARSMPTRVGEEPRAATKLVFRQKLREFIEAGKITRDEARELYRAAFPEPRNN